MNAVSTVDYLSKLVLVSEVKLDLENTYIITSDGELYHYGVVGMKWGVRKANRMSTTNARLNRKALNYDKKSAKLYKKSEKAHADYDLESSNRAAKKAAKYMQKAATARKKALDGDDTTRLAAEQKATKLEYKAAKKEAKANRLSKTTGYGNKAMKYSVKSDKVAIKAAKARAKMASNEAYISMMNKRLDSLDEGKLRKVKEPMHKYMQETMRDAYTSAKRGAQYTKELANTTYAKLKRDT